ncbi:MAG: cytochrome c-type biogenesis CcmF C-terminal domain-containing protein, partial [Gammaproteobacteria bacterium]
LGVSIAVRWRKTGWREVLDKLKWPALASLVFGVAFPLIYGRTFSFAATMGMSLAAWIVVTVSVDLSGKFRQGREFLGRAVSIPLSYYGMLFAHVGVAVTMVGITLVSVYNEEQDIRLMPGDAKEFAGYRFKFERMEPVVGENYKADRGVIIVTRNDKPVVTLYPEKRLYGVQGSVMTEAAIDPGLTRDLYVALGEPLPDGAWAVRLHYKPFVRWLWLGGILMAAGGFLAVADKRYRSRRGAETGDLAHA